MKMIGWFLVGLLMMASPVFAESGELALTGSLLLNAESLQKVDSPLPGTPLFVSITAENVGLGALPETVVNVTDLTSGGGATVSGTIPALAAGAQVTVQIPFTFASSGCRELNIQAALAGPATQRQLLVPVGSADVCNSGIDVTATLATWPSAGQPFNVGARFSISGTASYTGYSTPPLGAEVTVQFIQGDLVYKYSTLTRAPDGNWSISSYYLPDQSGDYDLKVSISDGHLRGSSSQVVTVSPMSGPNLRAQSLSFTGNELYQLGANKYAPADMNVQLSASFQNTGTAATGNVKVEFYLDELDPTPDTLLCEQVVNIALAGVNFSNGYPAYSSKNVVCPTIWKPNTVGVKNVYVLIDTDNAIAESHEDDNQLTSYLEARARKPNLKSMTPYFSGQPGVGETVKISGDIYNVGTADLPLSGFTVDFYDGVNLIGSTLVSASILKGQKTVATIDWNTSSMPAGYHNIGMVVDADGIIDEDFKSDNNSYPYPERFDVLDTKANLQVMEISLPNGAVIGYPSTINAKLKNRSVLAVTNSQINFYLGDPLAGGTLLGSVSSGAIARGGEKTVTLPWTPTSTGYAYIYARVATSGQNIYRAVYVSPTPMPSVGVVSSGIIVSGNDSTRTLHSSATISANISEQSSAPTGTFSVSFTAEGPEFINLGTRRISLGAYASTVVTAPLPLTFDYRKYLVRVAITDLPNGDDDYSNNVATQAAEANGGYPLASAGDDLSAFSGDLVTLGTTASVGPGFQWVLTQQPSGSFVSLRNATSRNASFYPQFSGVYVAELHATNGVENAYDSVEINVTHRCGIPNSLIVPATSISGNYKIMWGASSTVGVTYKLYQAGVTDPIYTGPNRSFTVTGKVNGTYSYSVQAIKPDYVDSAVKGPATVTVSLRCGTPDTLTVPTTSISESFKISWGISSTADVTYKLYQSGVTDPIYTGPNRTFTVSGKVNGTYSYSVQAIKPDYVDSAVNGPATVTVNLRCGTPSSLTVPATSISENFRISWGASSTAGVTYKLYQSGVTDPIYTGPNTYFNVTGKASGSYSYSVQAIRSGYLDSAVKGPATVTVAWACGTPSTLIVPATSSGNFTICWGASSTAGVIYKLYQSGVTDPIYTGPNRTFTVTGKANGSYSYSVQAIRSGYLDSAVKGPKTVVVNIP